jgi:hypothetical protein
MGGQKEVPFARVVQSSTAVRDPRARLLASGVALTDQGRGETDSERALGGLTGDAKSVRGSKCERRRAKPHAAHDQEVVGGRRAAAVCENSTNDLSRRCGAGARVRASRGAFEKVDERTEVTLFENANSYSSVSFTVLLPRNCFAATRPLPEVGALSGMAVVVGRQRDRDPRGARSLVRPRPHSELARCISVCCARRRTL